MKSALSLDEISAGKQSIGQLLNRALRRIQSGCQLGQGHAPRAQRHRLEDLDHAVDRAMRAGRHAADASKPFRPVQTGTCNEARKSQYRFDAIRICVYISVNMYSG